MTYFIKLGADAWIELGSFDFSAESFVNDQGAHSQSGPPNFGTINVEFSSDALLPSLIQKSTVGDTQDVIIRATVDSAANGEQATYDMVLSNAAIIGLNENLLGGPSLQLQYNEIGITTYTADASTEVFSPDGTFDWDVTTNDGTPENLPAVPGIKDLDTAAQGVLPATYVMAINGVGGSSAVEDHEGWFDITNFSYSMGRSYDIVGNELSIVENGGFSVTVADQTALTALMNLAAKDELISAIEIDGLSLSNIIQTQTLFGNVKIDSIADNGGNGYDINFVYTQIESEILPFDKGVKASIFSYDFTKDKADADITAPTPGASLDTDAPVQYFLALPGLAGDSITSGHERWFNLEDVNLTLDASGVLPDGNVELVLSNDTEIADIMARLVDGKSFAGATVRGVDGDGNVVYTLDMGNVSIGSLNDSSNGGFFLDLDFRQVELSTSGLDSSSVLTSNPSFGWDFDTGQALKSLASAAPGGKTPSTAVVPEKFYMLVDGMNGGSADPAHQRWFELTDFDFAAFMSGEDPDFSTLQAALGSDTALTAMIQAATTGSAIKGIRIEGVVDVGGIETRVYELALTDVRVASVNEFTGPGYEAEFDFGKFALRTFDGFTGKQSSVTGWDRVNDTGFSSRPLIAPLKGQSEAQATEFVFTATSIPGESELKGFAGTSAITDYSFNVYQPTLEGANAGDSELGRLTLTFATDTALPDFLFLATQGKTIETASLLGLGNTGKTSLQQVFSIDLNGGLVTAVNDFSGAGFSVEIDFAKFGITQQTINPLTGKLGVRNTFGWDDKLDQTTTVTGLKEGPKKEAVAPTSHFMAIDGFHGDLATAARGGWLDIADMTFGGVNSGEAGLSAGGGAGKFDLASITVSLETDSGLTALLEYMATGKAITGVQIEGTALTGTGAERTVQAYTLGEVYVSSVTDVAGPGYSVTFEAARFTLQNFQLNGTKISEVIWDLEANTPNGAGVIVSPGGSSGNDVLSGTREANTIDGLGGNDTIFGFDGADTLKGNTGNDRLFGGNGDDTLEGGDNNDILVGGTGKDTLTGGTGADQFRYTVASDSTPGVNRDIITDFQDGSDRIDVNDLLLPGTAFLGSGAFTGTNQIQVVTAGADAVIRVNISGDLTPDLEILVTGGASFNFSLADFIL